ncbi:MAG: ECF transporter S component [Butyrivibrio sp.]
MKKKNHILYICLAAAFTAIVCLITLFIQIPIPLGYFNIGNCIILTFCCLLPCPYGIIVGSAGSALADLLSFPVWAVPTLIIKAAMPLLFYGMKKLPLKSRYAAILIAGIVSMLIPFAGYTFTGAILYGSLAAGLSQVPGLALEYAANIVLFALLSFAVEKTKLSRLINKE